MHIMIDIETLGTRPGSVIASIGAIAFNPLAGHIDDGGLSLSVDIADAQRCGLRIEAGTVAWWLRQSEGARAATFGRDQCSLAGALTELCTYWRERNGQFAWSHGAGFDLVLLESAYFACGLISPWLYDAVRDTRTIYALAEIKAKDYFEEGATAHSALDDARAQARAVIAAYFKLGLAAPHLAREALA